MKKYLVDKTIEAIDNRNRTYIEGCNSDALKEALIYKFPNYDFKDYTSEEIKRDYINLCMQTSTVGHLEFLLKYYKYEKVSKE